MALGYARASEAVGAPLHDRLLLGATDAALAWAIWRGGALGARLAPPRGAAGACGGANPSAAAAAGPEAEAGAALAALEWGASGPWLVAVVDAQVRALQIQLLRKDATILSLKARLEGGGGSGGGGGIGGQDGGGQGGARF